MKIEIDGLTKHIPGTGDFISIDISKCNNCGNCCLDISDGHTPFGSDEEGKCNALHKEGDKWLCKAGWQKPFCCLADPTENDAIELGCSIKYK